MRSKRGGGVAMETSGSLCSRSRERDAGEEAIASNAAFPSPPVNTHTHFTRPANTHILLPAVSCAVGESGTRGKGDKPGGLLSDQA